MRGHGYFRMFEYAFVGNGFVLIDVQTGMRNLSAVQTFYQIVFQDHASTGCINDNDAFFHQCDLLAGDEFSSRHVKGDKICCFHHFIQRRSFHWYPDLVWNSVDVELDCSFFYIRIEGDHFHTETQGDLRYVLTNPSKTNDPKSFSSQLNAFGEFFLKLFKFLISAGRHLPVTVVQETYRIKGMCKNQLRNGITGRSRRINDFY